MLDTIGFTKLFSKKSPNSGSSQSLPALPLLLLIATLAGCSGGGGITGGGSSGGGSSAGNSGTGVPADIQAIFDKPQYKGATWGLRLVDVKTGTVKIDLNSKQLLLIGSVRKVFSVGELLDKVGPDYTYNTPIYRQGTVNGSGVLDGDLILVASGDLTMGGRTNPDGSIAVSNYDHAEADTLGNAVLTAPDPLAGYKAIAAQIAAAGITEITGEVIIDDRLFEPYFFRDEFNLTPIFVNDDQVDLSINPTTPGSPASVVSRPISAAFAVQNNLMTSAAGSTSTLTLNPTLPNCIGTPGCNGQITGNLPIDLVPPLTGAFPLVQTFPITQPSNYARTVLIEALEAAGVTVDAAPVENNPVGLLPQKSSYPSDAMITQFTGMPYSADAKLILKVSYNIGADTSLLLYGVTQGADTMTAALAAEQTNLAKNYGIPPTEYSFVDGSGGGETMATGDAITHYLRERTSLPTFTPFLSALPILGVDGSLVFVTDFESDPTLAGAKGNVSAKPGTFVAGTSNGIVLKTQALAGYVQAKSGRQLVFEVVVNNVPITGLNDVIQAFQDEGTISAILWRDY